MRDYIDINFGNSICVAKFVASDEGRTRRKHTHTQGRTIRGRQLIDSREIEMEKTGARKIIIKKKKKRNMPATKTETTTTKKKKTKEKKSRNPVGIESVLFSGTDTKTNK